MTGAIKRFFTKEPMEPYKLWFLILLTLLVLLVFDDAKRPSSLMVATYLAVNIINIPIMALGFIRLLCIELLEK